MEVYTKKTTDLSIKEKEGLVLLYNDTFDEHRTIEEFDRQFLNNPIGFSYHTIGVEDGIIVFEEIIIPSSTPIV